MTKNIELIKINKQLNFEFMIKEEKYEIKMESLRGIFLGGDIIKDDNKNALPSEIVKHIRKGERYRINEFNIEAYLGYIIVYLEMNLVEYYK